MAFAALNLTAADRATGASDDAALVLAARRGSRDAFRALVERYQTLVCAVAYASTGSLSASEEIAQEAFVAAWRGLPSCASPSASAAGCAPSPATAPIACSSARRG